MCAFLKKCNVNILETKDQRDKGIEHRLMKAWPGPFDRPDKIDKVLFQALTEDMKKNSQGGPTAVIFKKIVESGLVIKILEFSIFTAKQIFKVDTACGRQIKSLDEPQLFKQSVNLLGKGLMTNMGCYQQLLPEIKTRTQDYSKMSDLVNVYIEDQYKFGKVQDPRKNTDEGDTAEFEGGKLTRRKPGNGNLKRKVGGEIQGDPELTKLSSK